MSRPTALKALSIIALAFPSGSRSDEATEDWVRLAAESLQDYPDDLLTYLGHPKVGIITVAKFLPSISEMRAFIHAEWERRRKAQDWQDRNEARMVLEKPEPAISDEEKARVNALFKQLTSDLKYSGPSNQNPLVTSKIEEQSIANAWLDKQVRQLDHLPKLMFSENLRARLHLTEKE